jgi:hypothetical protein
MRKLRQPKPEVAHLGHGMMVHACNTSYKGNIGRSMVSDACPRKQCEILPEK